MIKIVFKKYNYGMAPVLMLNCLKNIPVVIKQRGEKDETIVMPRQYFVQTWDNPVGAREIAIKISPAPEKVYSLEMIVRVRFL